MKILQKTLLASSLFALSYMVVALFASSSIYAASLTWDGGGADTNFSTAENWVGDVAPVSGDDLTFDTDIADFASVLQNDMPAGTVYNSVNVTGLDIETVIIEGNDAIVNGVTASQTLRLNLNLSISADATYSGTDVLSLGFTDGTSTLDLGGYALSTVSNAMTINSVVSGSGGITNVSGSLLLRENNSFTGTLWITGGTVTIESHDGGGAGDIAIVDGAQLRISTESANGNELVIDNNLSLNGLNPISLSDNHFLPSGNASAAGTAVTLSGVTNVSTPVEVLANSWFDDRDIQFTNVVSGDTQLTLEAGSAANLFINGVEQGVPTGDTIVIVDSQPGTNITINDTEEYQIDGERGDIIVTAGGTLSGTGTVGGVVVDNGGTIAPGQSPGCLSTGTLALNGIYELEISGTTPCTEHDQIQVTGSVSLASPTINFIYGSLPLAGQTFTIIENDAADAVTGTFANPETGGAWLEGESALAGTVTYSISYVGGDGNDVVLTVIDAGSAGAGGGPVAGTPGAPSTGFSLNSVQTPALVAAISAALVALFASAKLSSTSYKK